MNSIDRRKFLLSTSSIGALAFNGGVPTLSSAFDNLASQEKQPTPKIEKGVAWYDVQDWGVEGKGWSDTARYYDRFPAKAAKTVRGAVWGLSRHSAGMMTQFCTNSPSIHVRYQLMSSSLAMAHMPATGVSGVDLYADDRGVMRWLQVVKPVKQQMSSKVIDHIDPLPNRAPRKFSMYLPLYNGVESMEIGVQEKDEFRPIVPRKENQMVFYGTSIMHGACASRPGMAISGILGRRFNLPVINLGFSGNGKMEKEVGDLLVELDPGLYAIDCLPNMSGDLVKQRAEPLVRQLREKHPNVPILLVEDRVNTNARFNAARRKHHAANRAALHAAFEHLQKSGVKHLYYLPGEELLGDDGEAATDGSHPSDLGMVRYADAYQRVIKQILKR